ncbi:MAG: Do family serine endopeptidase [Planctomycetes bacterium]|nr:Do family serine endopeptidase [Planctomycetota bacterium]
MFKLYNRKFGWGFCLALVAVFAMANISRAAEKNDSLAIAKAVSNAVADVAEQVNPAVVGILAEKKVKLSTGSMFPRGGKNMIPEELMRRFFDPDGNGGGEIERRIPGMGSGIIVDEEGHILTNNHVVEGDDVLLEVQLSDETKYKAELVGADPKSDLAVIKLIGFKKPLPVAKLGDSDTLRVGNTVIAIGNPFHLMHTVTVGIVSAKNRSIGALGKMMYQDFIQTDASINPGNSGGPLVNLDGEVVGINTAIRSGGGGSDGVGFAVPINQAKNVLKQLIENGKVTRGWLGIGIRDLTPDLAGQFEGVDKGILVQEVYPETPAGKAGLKHGDVIVAYNGKAVSYSRELQANVAATTPGETAKITIVRAGEKMVLDVVIAAQPEDPAKVIAGGSAESSDPEVAKSSTLGIEVQTLTDDLREKLGLEKVEGGVVVTDVVEDSPAGRAGLTRGSVLIEMNHKLIKDAASFREAEKALKDSKNVLLYFRQENMNRYLVIPLDR